MIQVPQMPGGWGVGIARCSAASSDAFERCGILIPMRRFSGFSEVSTDFTGKHTVVREIAYALGTFPRSPRDSRTIFQTFRMRPRSWMK